MKTVLAVWLPVYCVFGLAACGQDDSGTDARAGAASDSSVVDMPLASWNVATILPEPAVAYPSVVTVEDQVFVLGGRTLNTDSSSGRPVPVVNAYDPASEQWEEHTPIPVPLVEPNVAATGDRIYVLGGKGARVLYSYDPRAGTWEDLGERPVQEGIGASASAVRGTKIYLVGGVIPSSTNPRGARVDDFASYDTATGEWEALPPLPATNAFFGAGIVRDVLYTMGGSTEVGEVARPGQTFAFDFATNTWAEKEPLPTPVSSFAIATVSEKIYVFGGIAGETGRINPDVQIYDPATNTWSTTTPPMATPRFAAGATDFHGNVYIAGGVKQVSDTEFEVVTLVEIAGP